MFTIFMITVAVEIVLYLRHRTERNEVGVLQAHAMQRLARAR